MTRRQTLLIAGGAVAVLLVAAVWLVVRGLEARRHLVDASDVAAAVRDDLLRGDAPRAQARLRQMQADARDARSLTSDPVWRAVGTLPLLGRTFRTTQGLAVAADELARRGFPLLVQAGDALAPDRLRVRGDTIALAPLHQAEPPLLRAVGVLDGITRRARALPHSLLPGQVADARSRAVDQLARLAGIARTAADAARIAPAMLGEHGVRRYFVAVQNNAEARGTGGLVGAYLILETDHGRLRVTRSGSDTDFRDAPRPVVDLGAEFDRLYRPYSSDLFWSNSNLSPHLPYAAAIWAALWQRQSHQHIDGALALDPVTLSHVLAATGPVVLGDGSQINARNVVDLLLRQLYDLTKDPAVRKRALQVVARAAVDKALSGSGSAQALMSELGRAAGEHHLGLWSAHADEQRVIETTPIAQVLPTTTRPFAAVVVSNAAGNKLDYYLVRQVDYLGGPCRAGRRSTEIRARLTNAAPQQLPTYVTLRLDHPAPPGSNNLIVEVYVTQGARLVSATLDNRPVQLETDREREHPVFSTQMDFARGQSRVLDLRLDEPAVPGSPLVPEQPLVVPQLTDASVGHC